jgi:hypothetical protein
MNRDHDKQTHPMQSAADWISLAAAPTFALMALLTVALGGGQPEMLCTAAHGASPLGGMGLMYLLMSAFHSAPWLKLISRRREGALFVTTERRHGRHADGQHASGGEARDRSLSDPEAIGFHASACKSMRV